VAIRKTRRHALRGASPMGTASWTHWCRQLGTHRAGKNPGASFWSGTGAPKRLHLRVRPFVFLHSRARSSRRHLKGACRCELHHVFDRATGMSCAV